jgi:hypothetical protein
VLHPSARTNTRSLAGSETIEGGSIIIPILINPLATTKSIIKNGMKI